MGKIKDLKGKVYDSGIEVLEFDGIKNHSAYWKCKCSCGNIFITRGADLNNGHTKSCGCINRKKIQEVGKNNKYKFKDITNKRFGSLVALKPTEKRDNDRCVIWECQCDCGNTVELSSHALTQGQISCGCNKSKGELKIAQLLLENNIPFETQKTFETCRFPDTNRLARFDFFINNQYIIEYDGIQHFDQRFGWNTSNNYSQNKKRDEYKNEWCKKNNIPIIRIPYTKYNTLTINDLTI